MIPLLSGHSDLDGWTGRVLRRLACAASQKLQKGSKADHCIQVGTTVACRWNPGRDQGVGVDFESGGNEEVALRGDGH